MKASMPRLDCDLQAMRPSRLGDTVEFKEEWSWNLDDCYEKLVKNRFLHSDSTRPIRVVSLEDSLDG